MNKLDSCVSLEIYNSLEEFNPIQNQHESINLQDDTLFLPQFNYYIGRYKHCQNNNLLKKNEINTFNQLKRRAYFYDIIIKTESTIFPHSWNLDVFVNRPNGREIFKSLLLALKCFFDFLNTCESRSIITLENYSKACEWLNIADSILLENTMSSTIFTIQSLKGIHSKSKSINLTPTQIQKIKEIVLSKREITFKVLCNEIAKTDRDTNIGKHIIEKYKVMQKLYNEI